MLRDKGKEKTLLFEMVHLEKVCIFIVFFAMIHIIKVSRGFFGLFWFLF